MSPWPLSRQRLQTAWGVDLHDIAWHADGREQVAAHAEGAPRALAALKPGTRVQAIAAGDLALHWLQKPPPATRSLSELKLVAAARCAHLHGGSPLDWSIAADWSTRRAFVCAALPLSVVRPLEEACRRHRVRLDWHTGWSVMTAARQNVIPDEGWGAMRTPRRVHLWHCSHGRVDALTSFAIAADATPQEVESAVRTRMLLEGSAAPGVAHWTQVPAAHGEAAMALASATLLAEAA